MATHDYMDACSDAPFLVIKVALSEPLLAPVEVQGLRKGRGLRCLLRRSG
jgi:hypothetical protein